MPLPMTVRAAFLSAVVLLAAGPISARAEPALSLDAVKGAPASVRTADGTAAPAAVKVVRNWSGPLCRSRLVNTGDKPVRVNEILLFDVPHALPPETHLYG